MQAIGEKLLAFVVEKGLSGRELAERNQRVEAEHEPLFDEMRDEPQHGIGAGLAAAAVGLARASGEWRHIALADGAAALEPFGRDGGVADRLACRVIDLAIADHERNVAARSSVERERDLVAQ